MEKLSIRRLSSNLVIKPCFKIQMKWKQENHKKYFHLFKTTNKLSFFLESRPRPSSFSTKIDFSIERPSGFRWSVPHSQASPRTSFVYINDRDLSLAVHAGATFSDANRLIIDGPKTNDSTTPTSSQVSHEKISRKVGAHQSSNNKVTHITWNISSTCTRCWGRGKNTSKP